MMILQELHIDSICHDDIAVVTYWQYMSWWHCCGYILTVYVMVILQELHIDSICHDDIAVVTYW